jgi:PAS domain S-box-containing protein
VPYLILGIALAVTIAASYATSRSAAEKDQLQFAGLTQRVQTSIARRLEIYITLLRSEAALFASRDDIDNDQFHAFVDRLHLRRNYPGLQGIGFAPKVASADLARFVEGERAASNGTFHVWPTGSGDIHFPILYLDPPDDSNRAAIGFDMYTEPVRRQAMNRAWEEGRAIASGRVRLMQGDEDSSRIGFLIYLPIYAGGYTPGGRDERVRDLRGFVYAPFRVRELLQGVMGDEARLLDFQVFDDSTTDAAHLLFSSSPVVGADTLLTHMRQLGVQGRAWTLRFAPRPEFQRNGGGRMVPYIFVGGALISVLLFGVTRSQVRALEATERIAGDLRRSEERYRTIVETAPDVIYTVAADGSITSLSPAFETLTGWGPGEWIGQPFAPLVHPDDLMLAMGMFMKVLEGESPPNYELRIRASGGEYLIGEFRSRPQIENGAVVGAIGVARDITGRRRADEALRQSEERYRAFVENSTEAIWRIELDVPVDVTLPPEEQIELFYRDARLAECNIVMAKMYGFERPEEIVGARLGDLLVRSNPANIEYLMSFIGSGYRLNDAVSEEVDREGRELYFSNNLAGVVEEGKLVRAWGMQRDITERLRVERERERLLELEQQARAEAQAASRAKDHFLAVLSHELRTPLTPVLVAMEYLGNEVSLPDDLKAMLDMIGRNVALEARLIDDLLDLTGIVNGKLQLRAENIDAHALLGAAADVARREIAVKHIDLRFELIAPRHRVQADPARLQQVFWNLIKNAVKFTPDGGRIVVRTSNVGARLRVEIEDTGIGIEPAVLDRIFDPFEQGERTITRRYGGLGLGLAISRMLVEMHGGTISAASSGSGSGATFIVELDAANEPHHIASRPREDSPAAPGISILYVEDHEDTARVIKLLLEGRGYRVTVASDLAGARAAATGRRFDLMISDIGLPDGTGLDLMRDLRACGAVARGIAISGFGTREDIARSIDAGFSEHLIKPVNFQQLDEAVRRIVGR